jgi:3-phenylpropionate/trans-cinnamate dioxygenase ferredoxin reductase component
MNDGILIVGGGLAGQRCAETLRRAGYTGAVRIVCAEPERPYNRPPLSKQILTGHSSAELPAYKPTSWYEQQEIDLLLGVSATALSVAERRLTLSDGQTLRYDRLLIATGSRPRTLSLLEGHDNVSVLRTIGQARHLREVLGGRPRLSVLGAGFIGQEVAASARKLGAEVTMIEAAPCPLANVLGHDLGEWFTRLHQAEGVDVIAGATVERVSANGTISALELSNGQRVATDHVIVGVGVEPDADWLASSGLRVERGVPVDQHGRTEAEGVYAAGDVAATFDSQIGAHVPGSHWESAGRQGARAARAMLGLEPGAAPLTSFWTDQYGIRIQYLGHARLADAYEIDGDLEGRDFTATFTRSGRPVAALIVNRPRALPAARALIERKDPHDLSD